MKSDLTFLRRIGRSLLCGILVITPIVTQGQTSHTVDVTNNVFFPNEITINLGDTVIWKNSEGFHNVNGSQSTYPSNPGTFGNGAGFGWTYSYVFTETGTYDYQCDPHVGLGMVGKVLVLAPPDTLTVNFIGMNKHIGQNLWFAVYDETENEEIIRLRRSVEESFNVKVPGIKAGRDYTVDFYADHNGNGYYDPPSSDHAWRIEIENAPGDTVLDFIHNTNFIDIEWEHRVTVNFSGMDPHIGQEMYIALIESGSGEIVDRKSESVLESFSVDLREIVPGKDYHIDFFSDHNGNGYYDAPSTDHAWRLELNNTAGDTTVEFPHNKNFTDVLWKHRLKVRFEGMNNHIGQAFTFYVRDKVSGKYHDTIMLTQVPDADFDIESYAIKPGVEYAVEFYADHNGNGSYDAPPLDHSWRLFTNEIMGDTDLQFQHNTEFTDILSKLVPDVLLADDQVLGSILTDAEGFTLYYFTKDAWPDTSFCMGGCVTNWPLFYAEDLLVGEGLDSNDFSAIEHPEGGMQNTYKGWPLYYFKNDLNPGETNGEAFGNVWFVAKPDYSIMLMDNMLTGMDGITYNGIYEQGEELVQYFVDEYGNTLYTWVNDNFRRNNFTKSDFSNNGSWPIYEEELNSVASILDKSLFTTINVHGRTQLTYKGWPLYYFGSDSVRGNTLGVSVPNPGIWPVAVKDSDPPILSSSRTVGDGDGLRIYPNPVIRELNVQSEDIIESIVLFSISGAAIQRVSDINISGYSLQLDDLSPGVYFIRVRTAGNQPDTRRIIKQ